MDNSEQNKPDTSSPDPDADVNALETPESERSTAQSLDNQPPAGGPKKSDGLKQTLKKFNVYLVLFGFILVVAAMIIAVAYFQSKKASNTTIKTQSLTNSTLQQLADSDATVGGPQEVLNVESNAVFAGKVLIRESLQLAGGLQVTGTTNLQDLSVTGQSSLQNADVAQNLTVGGNVAVQGSATFAQGIQVNGSGTFSGPLSASEVTTPNLQITGTLVLTHHITAGGPNASSISGNVLGSGGTTSLSGSDTAGAVTINTGGNPTAGCFITVTFNQAYTQTPYVEITPVGQAAGGLQYYITRTNSNFSICSNSAPPASSSFGFDYFVVD